MDFQRQIPDSEPEKNIEKKMQIHGLSLGLQKVNFCLPPSASVSQTSLSLRPSYA